jgi:hypothetical protein
MTRHALRRDAHLGPRHTTQRDTNGRTRKPHAAKATRTSAATAPSPYGLAGGALPRGEQQPPIRAAPLAREPIRHPRPRGARAPGSVPPKEGHPHPAHALTRDGRFPHNPNTQPRYKRDQMPSGESTVHSRDNHPAQTQRRIHAKHSEPKPHTQALRPGGEHTEHRLRPEAPPRPTVRTHAHRGHARHYGRVATARTRAAWKALTRQKAAQRVTVPIDRRTAAQRARPIQAGGGSVPFRCHGRTRRAIDTTATDRIDAPTRCAHTTGARVAA